MFKNTPLQLQQQKNNEKQQYKQPFADTQKNKAV
jgi:hypothetical protein